MGFLSCREEGLLGRLPRWVGLEVDADDGCCGVGCASDGGF